MFKKRKELHDKYEEGTNTEQQRDDETILAFSSLQIFFAGLETTTSAMESFIRAMVLFPSVQEKAQAEIDGTVGSGRFPTFNDQADLPFLRAVILETLRWNPVVPS
ncbi:hypothetical protein FRC00_000161, partial [Tulasnella sp. 408]